PIPTPKTAPESSDSPSNEDSSGAILDPNRIDDIRQLQAEGEDVIGDLLELFRLEIPPRLEELAHACRDRDSGKIAFLSHAICGVCHNLGAPRLAQICHQIQNEAEKKNFAAIEPLFEQLRKNVPLVEQALAAARASR